MMKRPSKKLLAARSAFKQRVIEFIESLGAIPSDGLYAFTVTTPAGEVGISIDDCTIFCRFSDVAAATQFTATHCGVRTSNPYSGKWNWHYTDDVETLGGGCERDFVFYFERLMKWSR
jgi:hypothetical protein